MIYRPRPYRPLSEARKEQLSLAHRRRLGIPDGMRRVYGHDLPEDLAAEVYPAVADVARRQGYQAAHDIAGKLKASVEPPKGKGT